MKKSIFSKFFKSAILLVMTLAFIFSCAESGTKSSPDGTTTQQVSFNYKLTSPIVSQSHSVMSDNRNGALFEGTLTLTDSDGVVESHPWTAWIDENVSPPTIETNNTLLLTPGIYTVDLLLSKGTHSYAAQAENVEIMDVGATNPVLTLQPIIYDAEVGLTKVETMAKLFFTYDKEELKDIDDPGLDVTVTTIGGTSTTRLVFESGNNSVDALLDLQDGDDVTMSIKFYSGNRQIGKSDPAQENFIFSYNADIILDIYPLAGYLNFIAGMDGGSSTLSLSIPDDILAEVDDDIANLSVQFKYASAPDSTLVVPQGGQLDVTLFDPAVPGDPYTGTVTIDPLYYDKLNMEFSFLDNRETDPKEKEFARAILHNAAVDNSTTAFAFSYSLIEVSDVMGSLYGAVNICVTDNNNAPAPLASLYQGNRYIGLTATGADIEGAGCKMLFLKKGSYYFKAEKDGFFGVSNDVSIKALGTDNVGISLSTPITSRGNRLHFDGVDDYVKIEDLKTFFNGATEFTVETKFQLDNAGVGTTTDTLFSLCNQSEDCGIKLRYNHKYQMFKISIDGAHAKTEPVVLTTDIHDVAIVYDGPCASIPGRLKLYLDGVEQTLTFYGLEIPAAIPLYSNTYFILGATYCSTPDYLNGSINEMRIWEDLRTDLEISNHLNTNVAGETGLKTYYEFSQGVAGGDNFSSGPEDVLFDSIHSTDGMLKNFTLDGPQSNWL